PPAGHREARRPRARCGADRTDRATSGSDLQRHVTRPERIDVAGRYLCLFGPQPCADVELNAIEYDNVREVSGCSSRVGAGTLREVLLAIFRIIRTLRKCAGPGAAASAVDHQVRPAR